MKSRTVIILLAFCSAIYAITRLDVYRDRETVNYLRLAFNTSAFQVSVLVDSNNTWGSIVRGRYEICCGPGSSTVRSQYATLMFLIDYFQNSVYYTPDVSAADIVLIPFSPFYHGYHVDYNKKMLLKELPSAGAAYITALKAVKKSAHIVIVNSVVPEYKFIKDYFLRYIESDFHRRIIMLRIDYGDTVCNCYGTGYDPSDTIENIAVPYAVFQPEKLTTRGAWRDLKTPRENLLFFKGRRNGSGRMALLSSFQIGNRTDIAVSLDDSMSHEIYVDNLFKSKFCLVPEGHTTTSSRLFESLAAECVPVIISTCIDLPFEGMSPIEDYSLFAVFFPTSTNAEAIIRHLDALVSSGIYGKLRVKLSTVWEHFIMRNATIGENSSTDVIFKAIMETSSMMQQNKSSWSSASDKRKRAVACSGPFPKSMA